MLPRYKSSKFRNTVSTPPQMRYSPTLSARRATECKVILWLSEWAVVLNCYIQHFYRLAKTQFLFYIWHWWDICYPLHFPKLKGQNLQLGWRHTEVPSVLHAMDQPRHTDEGMCGHARVRGEGSVRCILKDHNERKQQYWCLEIEQLKM